MSSPVRMVRVFLSILFVLLTLAPAASGVLLRPGDIIVADRSAFGGQGGIIHVDPNSGVQTIVSSGGDFDDPWGVAVERSGQILVADQSSGAFFGPERLGTGLECGDPLFAHD